MLVADLTKYRSHPDKQLIAHTSGVVEKVRSLTSLKITELAAIFHDVGKLNPNFQRKLDTSKVNGYSNHAYLSAFSFLCYCAANQEAILKIFNNEKEWLGSIIAIIAHHHGDLPDFPVILTEDEYSRLLSFLKENPELPVTDLIKEFIEHKDFSVLNHQLRNDFQSRIQYQLTESITKPVDFFLETQFAFAALIAADKSDASHYQNNKPIQEFCSQYHNKLDTHLKRFSEDSELNKIRSQMRAEANQKINEELLRGKSVFSLTAPTGSGKTMMLLSLAGEILKSQHNLRIIYALPYLSITEQVETVCDEAFNGLSDYIYRVDSKSENTEFEKLQAELDKNPTAIKKILASQFAEDTFDYPFIITTFVRLFETLVSNQNATLLKLPNFSNTIFLIDEIQSLPPRLYSFFVAMLDAFCKKLNSYAVISTATMPNFMLPKNNKHNLNEFFKDYVPPPELLSLEYFNETVFNRYCIENLPNPIELKELTDMIEKERDSVLVILNTIQDTKDLFKELSERTIDAELILLNTHFTPNDRKAKIVQSTELINEGKRVVLISTQLIEAGVDIDFPIVYRDFGPIPSIVQSAGRCNRNGKHKEKGRAIIFNLQKSGLNRSTLIYRGRDSRFLNFAKEKIQASTLQEPELLTVQQAFFNDIQTNTLFGVHYGKQFKDEEIDFIQRLKEGAFAEIGKFRLIDEQVFGEEYRYYVSQGDNDTAFEQLKKLDAELKEFKFNDFTQRRFKYIQIENHLKKMAGNIVRARLKQSDVKPIACGKECCRLLKLSKACYNSITGIQLSTENQFI
jgi:CRISPR-associated endonuclease/helicase Cas3